MGWWLRYEFPNEVPDTTPPLCVSDLLWILCRQPGFSAGGLGVSLTEARRMTFEEIYNLMRPADKRGNPTNEKVMERRIRADYLSSREDAEDILNIVRGIEDGRRR